MTQAGLPGGVRKLFFILGGVMKKICLLTLLLTAVPVVYGQQWEPSPRWEPSPTFGKRVPSVALASGR